MIFRSKSFMNENLSSKNSENDGSNLDTEDRDYNNLINRLKEIKKNILLLQKATFK